jgi:act minimal PKS acyl carrier protein
MAAKEFTIDDLRRILRDAAGEPEGEVDLDSDILDVTFIDLGYDSVALLETSRRIELERSVELGDSTVNDAHTPRALLAVVNGQLGAAAAV